MPVDDVAASVYEKLVDEEDARACSDIEDAACREVPGNFTLLLAAYVFTRIGDAVANPKTVLAWVTGAVGAPSAVLGFLVPIRESGSLIPQLLIARYIRQLPVRKWIWVIGSVVQALCIGGLGVVAFTLSGAAAGWAIIVLVTLFSLARGFCSIAAKDVLGKTIPKRQRGQLTGWSASAAGLVTLAVAGVLLFPAVQSGDRATFAALLVAAACTWLAGAATYARLCEYPGATAGGGNAIDEAVRRLGILATDAPFRRFVIARALLMCSALSAPYYVALGQQRLDSPLWLLGLFVAADGLANLVSGPVWGRLADRSSRQVMSAAALTTSATGLVVVIADVLLRTLTLSMWFLPLAYFVLAVAHSGVRVGRKTYVVDLGSGNRRTDYVAVSNSVIGVLLLAVGALGTLASILSLPAVIAILSGMGLVGALVSRSLPDA